MARGPEYDFIHVIHVHRLRLAKSKRNYGASDSAASAIWRITLLTFSANSVANAPGEIAIVGIVVELHFLTQPFVVRQITFLRSSRTDRASRQVIRLQELTRRQNS